MLFALRSRKHFNLIFMSNKNWLRYGVLFSGLYLFLFLVIFASLTFCSFQAKASKLDGGGCLPFGVLFGLAEFPGSLITQPLYMNAIEKDCKIVDNFDEIKKQMDEQKPGTVISIESKSDIVCNKQGNAVKNYHNLVAIFISALFYFLLGVIFGMAIKSGSKKTILSFAVIFAGILLVMLFVAQYSQLYFMRREALKESEQNAVEKIQESPIQNIPQLSTKAVDNNLEVSVSQILICYKGAIDCGADISKNEALKIAESIKKSASRDNFKDLISRYGKEKYANHSSNIGYFKSGEMVGNFEAAAFAAKVGEVVGPIETEYGYHIIYKDGERKINIR